MQGPMTENNNVPPRVLVIDSPLATPDFRAYRIRQLIDGVTQTSFVRVLSILSIAFKILQIGINAAALIITRNTETQTPFKLFIVVYTALVAAHTVSFAIRHWGYIFNQEPLEFTQSAESTLFNNLLDILTLFLYFIGFKWLQQYHSSKDEIPILYNLTRIWVFYGIAIVLAPIFSVILILLLLNYVRPTLPVIEYTLGGKIKEEDAQCTICLAPYAEKEQIRKLPCKHHFHMTCIDEWFGIDDVCPLCKRPINPLYDIAGTSI
ncbi:hypothetical protein NEPAR06_1556 [Nematocida parisii]|nr:hypothetical protein NEPAR08_1024 [Nematocida parisii]KAI5128248.1 hypothetical protein NEPAR03_1256 [Nematocida parisii]KAI5142416.1 hypothetical protein NEPAR04_1535 [Nematocida parisii]KAI5145249.1 hypothetical protein NEPAR07_1557 [Nematocida parisii]KAI5155117.1 hypothetical protein NEPAR06_1556 [Nematocida parisii]